MLRRLIALSASERSVLLKATLRVAAVRLRLSRRPIAEVMAQVRRWAARPLADPAVTPETVIWAVSAAGRRLLKSNPCLTEALAAWSLLRQYGFESQIRIGVAREGRANLQAHAWVERDDEILIGGDESPDAYVPLPLFEVS